MRVEDTIGFAKLMGYRKIGIATCIGLLEETNRLASILKAQGFVPVNVCCKTGSIDKLELGLCNSCDLSTLAVTAIKIKALSDYLFVFVSRAIPGPDQRSSSS